MAKRVPFSAKQSLRLGVKKDIARWEKSNQKALTGRFKKLGVKK